MKYNPTQHGACNLSNIVKAGWKKFQAKDDLGAVLDQRVVSTPNGRSYGPVGFVPCDHVLYVQYERGHYQFDGKYSRVTLA
jgi:hypothetical protein